MTCNSSMFWDISVFSVHTVGLLTAAYSHLLDSGQEKSFPAHGPEKTYNKFQKLLNKHGIPIYQGSAAGQLVWDSVTVSGYLLWIDFRCLFWSASCCLFLHPECIQLRSVLKSHFFLIFLNLCVFARFCWISNNKFSLGIGKES